ncbi:hypothetical protein M514_11127 [Trichuris suis]|uniref:VOC domain-containing protein n=1 Tax=Trichuris suis TaxID=68888 RepID=A0A085LSQ3_9BILA|nr:hypothetical protein M513_11127 [Trichuris suis]KFD63214.1 hypothetical protein M514_11127 [Trichuris suis]
MMRRSLHYVIRVGDLMDSLCFYVGKLGMRVLRHEEFPHGCKATCNGPFGGKWSKTMVGYGPEDDHFVLEVVYNYGITSYDLGNFHAGFGIQSREAFAKVTAAGAQSDSSGVARVLDPNGYTFFISNADAKDPFRRVTLRVRDLNESREYYEQILGLKSSNIENDSISLSFSDDQVQLKFFSRVSKYFSVFSSINRSWIRRLRSRRRMRAYSFRLPNERSIRRVVFKLYCLYSCVVFKLASIEKAAKQAGYNVLTSLTDLDTPGKATVSVVILADPDGHEICCVGDENYRALSKWEPETELVWKKAFSLSSKYRLINFTCFRKLTKRWLNLTAEFLHVQ